MDPSYGPFFPSRRAEETIIGWSGVTMTSLDPNEVARTEAIDFAVTGLLVVLAAAAYSGNLRLTDVLLGADAFFFVAVGLKVTCWEVKLWRCSHQSKATD
jgi:hypothetical protein